MSRHSLQSRYPQRVRETGGTTLLGVVVALATGTAVPGGQLPLGAQERAVAGVVVSAQTQLPLSGARVEVEGTDITAVADAGGNFRLSALSGSEVSLRVTMLGYRPLTRAVRMGDANVRLALTELAVELDELVVTGTPGATQKRALGTTVGQLNAVEAVEVSPANNLQQLLGGRIAGVTILPGSGNVGTGGATRVRGVSSLTLTNEPLIYVDGLRVNNDPAAGPSIRQGRQVNRLNDINAEDIESVEIIKGPAAATLYGTEASNGVIQIITKRGSGSTGTPIVDVAVKQGGTWLMDARGKVPTVYSTDRATGQLLSVHLLDREEAAGRPIFQTGHNQSYDVGMRGGIDLMRYYLSGQWERREGIVDYNWSNMFNARMNLNLVPSDKVEIDANMGYVQSETRFAQAASGWGIWDQLVWGSPARLDTPTRGFLRVTPEAAGEIDSRSDVARFTGGLRLNHRPFEWFTHRLTAGVDNTEEDNQILFPRNPAGTSYFFGALSLGDKDVERNSAVFYTVDYAATGAYRPTPSLSLETSVGAQYYVKQLENVGSEGRFFPAPAVTEISGAAQTFSSEESIENRTLGLYVQEQVSLNNRIFLTGAVRGDDNSAFGESFDFVVYPKVSASWVLSEEPFWNLGWVNQLKIRGAWGRAGQQPDVFAAIRLYQPSTGPGDASVVTPLTIGNPDLKPEVGEEIELGFDAGILDNRVSVGFSYYDRSTKDAIVEKEVAPSSGFSGVQFVNLGEVTSKGIELDLSGRLVETGTLGWSLGAHFSTNNSEVVSTGGLGIISLNDRQDHREGYPVGAYFIRSVVSADLAPNGTASNIMCDGGPDMGGPPVPCSNAPRVFMGVPNPTWEGSVSTDLILFGDLRLFGLVDFRGGHKTANGDIEASHHTFRNSRAINERTNPILMGADQTGNRFPSGLYDSGFAKLREVSATYTLPQGLARSLGASRASVSVSARNLATLWRAQKDIFGHPIPDPEVRTPSSNLSGYVQTVIPPLSTFEAVVRLTF